MATPSVPIARSPYLAMHLFQDAPGYIGIIGGLRILPRHVFPGILEVRHIDIEYSVQQVQGLERVVSTCIIDEGDGKARFDGLWQRLQYVGNEVGRAHEIDIVASAALEIDHHPAEFIEGYRPAFTEAADGVVLAENTPEIAGRS